MTAPTPAQIRARSKLLLAAYPDDSGGPSDVALEVLIDDACGVVMLLTARTIGLTGAPVAVGSVGPFGCAMEDVPPAFQPYALRLVATLAERASVKQDPVFIESVIENASGGLSGFTAGPYSEQYWAPGSIAERKALDGDPDVNDALLALCTDCARYAWLRMWDPAVYGAFPPARVTVGSDYFPESYANWWPYSPEGPPPWWPWQLRYPMALKNVLKHTAVVRNVSESGNRVEGERDEEPVDGPSFNLVVFPPGTRESGRGGRRLEQPIALYLGFDLEGNPLRLTARDVIDLVDAPGLDPISLGRYEVDGDPIPLGKPGRALGAGLKGYELMLRRVQGGSSGSA